MTTIIDKKMVVDEQSIESGANDTDNDEEKKDDDNERKREGDGRGRYASDEVRSITRASRLPEAICLLNHTRMKGFLPHLVWIEYTDA